ncbi:MAG: hypothetical protein JJU28_01700 [Cyclobacteriaceae bacterium]|nr:hypothetical protein [Cyclobacteriaceae bacterium]
MRSYYVFVVCFVSYLQVGVASPLVTNYFKSEYGGGSKNWSLAQDSLGFLYVGNDAGLLEFDGSKWALHAMPNHMAVRSVNIQNDRIYVGSYEEFGFFKRDVYGNLYYTSISDSLKDYNFQNDDIWKIWKLGEEMLFQSFGKIFVYDNKQVKYLFPPGNLLFMHQIEERCISQLIGGGLTEFSNGRFTMLENTRGLEGVLGIEPYNEEQWLMGTSVNGFYVYDPLSSTLEAWNVEASDFIKRYQLNTLLRYGSDQFVAGTILNGIIIFNSQGKILRHISKLNGLQNNTVLSLMVDRELNLWAGLNLGIDHIEINSPYSFFQDKTGQIGAVHSAVLHEGKLYLGTNQGLFYKDWHLLNNHSSHAEDFRFVPNSQGHVLELSVHDGQLFCGHNRGTFLVDAGPRFEQISPVTGGWHMHEFIRDEKKYLIQGTYTDLVVYVFDPQQKWKFSHRIRGFSEPVKRVLFDNAGNLWVSHAYKGIYKLKLDEDMRTVESRQYYGKNEGFPVDFNIHVYMMRDQLVFTTGQSFYTYDPLADAILPYDILNEYFKGYKKTKWILPAGKDRFWLVHDSGFVLTGFVDGKLVVMEEHPSAYFNFDLVEGFENIQNINDSLYLICLHNGFVLYDQKHNKQSVSDQIKQVYLRSVESQSGILPIYHTHDKAPAIPFAGNFISISFASPVYSRKDLVFQYKLDGLDENWHQTTTETNKEYVRLPPGNYRFLVKVKGINHQLTDDTSYSFTVLPPWYATRTAWILYMFGSLIIFLVIRAFFKIRYENRQRALQDKLLQEKEEQLKQEAIEAEKRLMKVKNERLEDEIKYKSRQLANSAVGIIKKNEVLIEIKNELSKGKRDNGKDDLPEHIKKVMKIINHNLTGDEDWQIFESNFDQAHENFLKLLRKRYPDLTPKDLRFCAYLRMNISSKEIASLLNISVRGVEIRRYRLRRKLGLPHDKNLVEFMLELQ